MKIAIIGGAGVRVPLLTRGLLSSELPIEHFALYDVDRQRLSQIGRLAEHAAHPKQVEFSLHHGDALNDAALSACLANANIVFMSIRPGDVNQRARDEQTALEHQVIGQETIGPAGFAMAMRTIPHALRYAEMMEAVCPDAWILNFTNPVSIITQAIYQYYPKLKINGICDTPSELFAEVAHLLNAELSACHFDYVGLNHLGFLREVYIHGRPHLKKLIETPDLLRQAYRTPVFSTESLTKWRILPTEYVYYYLHPDQARDRLAQQNISRGKQLVELNSRFFIELNACLDSRAAALKVYEAYLKERDSTYMSLEAGALRTMTVATQLTGYDKIALSTARAIFLGLGDVIALNVANHGNLSFLRPNDIIEVPCIVNRSGVWPLHCSKQRLEHETDEHHDLYGLGEFEDLIKKVKAYERQTIAAAVSKDQDAAREALQANPLIDSDQLASQLIEQLIATGAF